MHHFLKKSRIYSYPLRSLLSRPRFQHFFSASNTIALMCCETCIRLFIYNHDHWRLIRFTQSDTSSTQIILIVLNQDMYVCSFQVITEKVFCSVSSPALLLPLHHEIIAQYWCPAVITAHNIILPPIPL